jgi:hypothetical protein
MSRELPPELISEIEGPVIRPFFAIFIDLPDPVRAWTGVGTLTFDDGNGTSRDWIGAGGMGALDTVGEATDGSATGVKATLYDVPSEFRDDIADQATKGAAFEVYLGAIDTDFMTIVGTQLIWRGRVDSYTITDAGETISVEVAGESRGIDQRRPSVKRFTSEYQQRKSAGDRFFEFVPQMAEIQVIWAKAESKSAIPFGGGGGGGGGGGLQTNFFSQQ